MWPELAGILFNVYEGKSSEWGVSVNYSSLIQFSSFFPLHFIRPYIIIRIRPLHYLPLIHRSCLTTDLTIVGKSYYRNASSCSSSDLTSARWHCRASDSFYFFSRYSSLVIKRALTLRPYFCFIYSPITSRILRDFIVSCPR